MKRLDQISVQYLRGVGPRRKKRFERLGVESLEDLLYFFPRRYEDRREVTRLSDLKAGEWQTVSGTVLRCSGRKSWHTKKHVYEVEIGDSQSRLVCVWFNRPYLDRYLKVGQHLVLYGKVDIYKNRLQLVSPDYEIISDDEDERLLSMGRIVPIYPLTRGMTQRYLRQTVKGLLEQYACQIIETLPYSVRQHHQLENIVKSLLNIHFPESTQAQDDAYRRISFEEFFLFQVSVFLRRLNIIQKQGICHAITDDFCLGFEKLFPFSFTPSQKQVISEIRTDLACNRPMHRLLQGDVGSGKTLVALFGCMAAVQNGYQAAVMAPTEILARQHFDVFSKVFASSSWRDRVVKLFVASSDRKKYAQDLEEIRLGNVDLVIGTHALIQDKVEFKHLSFAVIDEQHKFGVRQRALLFQKGINPDILVMTATPIPRTLCLTLYGDLDVSVIAELPPQRGIVRTLVFSSREEADAYHVVQRAVRQGEQAYIIYPVIDDSEKMDLKSADQMFKRFQKHEFQGFRVGLIHGKMQARKAHQVMQDFKDHQIDILVATTVLEVGVDIPNATVMLIEHAERFGLSQLHQLRGRIGRGQRHAQCLLIADPVTQDAQARIRAMASTNNGFQIAEQDLKIRGPGEFFGRHQHGLNELRIANPLAQMDILKAAREEASDVTQRDPTLKKQDNTVIREAILRRYPHYLANILSG